ncbi:nonribosomal peptide synthetase [Pochonia chlamydosporia 170]|uniref:Nonribosomal peptide synthetase n=1 Tax=Pochonia chlamydosporia 170 TaxID=1380566 RepID=A0A179G1L3_METCM|nr:nonribosomal peptide synthetase [Pochonia chlamydosporia 170]OAQ71119.1 nonribosomal peptide synthetase [Pochonia chlamydosporia 170]
MHAIDCDASATAVSEAPPNTNKNSEMNDPKKSDHSNTQTHTLSDRDLDQIWTWNKELPPLIQRCMHDIIREVSQRQPNAAAVSSWDGSLTYREVDELSTLLAEQLRRKGVSIGTRIPLCFEKSMWAVVSLLGVMKAGATFSLTDPSQPEARLRTIVEQTEADIIVTSTAQRDLGLKISRTGQVIAVSREYFDHIAHEPTEPLPLVPASSAMYIIFTSGSTGKPKGVVISHENYTSGALPRAEAVGYKSHSRVFDFPSYAFDVSIDCMLCTLANGGTVCVPSEADRMNDLSGAIRKSKANMVHMTPSVARVLDADIIPSLDVLGLGGEAVSSSDAATWSQDTSLVIAYGPSECTVGCTINNTLDVSRGIGKGVGGTTWITNPDDHNILMGVGEVGELLIEGPVVGIGYLGEPEKTAEVFIQDPTWLTAGNSEAFGRTGRLYKTGDLVRYESNNLGSIEFVGRKDQQVKIRGQRVELTEVEHHLQSCLPRGIKIAAEVIRPETTGAPTLVAFIAEPFADASGMPTEYSLVEPSQQLALALSTVDKDMGAKVPRYMVPQAFFTLQSMPTLVSGKTDRKKLREIAASIPREKFAGAQNSESQIEEDPETEAEKQLAEAWRKVLGPNIKIYNSSNFFGVGGDSLRAMRLVAAARENGLSLTVANVFMNPTLEAMSLKAMTVSASSSTQSPIAPFSLLEQGWNIESARKETGELCSIEPDAVEDIYPCTPLQEALMALSAKVKEAYIAQRVVELADIDTADRLITAFDTAQDDCPILRTRIAQVPGRGLVQVVVKGKLSHFRGTDLNGYLVSDRGENMELGQPLVRYAVITDEESGKTSFVLTMHHALYDGWCMPLIVDRVNKAYLGQTIKRPAGFKDFIKYLCDMDKGDSEMYWREQLHGANGPQFPSHPFPGYQAKADSLLEEYVSLDKLSAGNTTVATVIRAAWAYVASQYSNNEDVVFGETLTGRNAAIIGAEEIEGPMITTVPVRVQVDSEISVAEYLQTIQEQTVEQIPHEHFGLQHIRRLSPDAFDACELKTGLVLHPSTANDPVPEQDLPANRLVPAGDSEAAQEALKFNTYSLMLVCSIDPNGFLVMASFDSATISSVTMQRALNQFKSVSQALCQSGLGCVGDIECLTADDLLVLKDLVNSTRQDALLNDYQGVEGVYIVDPKDVNKLRPAGAVGEVVVQTVSPPALPSISPPSWTREFHEIGETKFYRTGKLAKYTTDGHLQSVDLNPTQPLNGTAAQTVVKRVSATSRRQKKLRSLWSRVLHINEENIGLNDNFFLLGGDSITAMKLVSEARADGVKLTVVQMFQKRTLYDMASVMEEIITQASPTEKPAAFSLLGDINTSEFVETIVRPQLANKEANLLDILPTRPLQEIAVRGTTQIPRYSARYELMYFDEAVDEDHLRHACAELVSRNEILRTVFIEHNGQCYSAVLEALNAEFIIDCPDNSTVSIEDYARHVCRADVLSDMPLGSSFVKWFLVKFATGKSCLIFRLSHAQYDEICLPILLKQLSALYENRPVQESVPFSAYVGHVLQHNVPESTQYWKDLLAGSAMTILKPEIPVEKTNHFAIHHTVDISSRPRDVTVATLPTAAWALCLARRLSLQDVTFGEVVSGRNIDFPNADAVTGPCWQYVPVRVKFEPSWTVADLLAHIQHQHVASSAHEGMGLSEIRDKCTDWPESTPDWFDSVVHQDVAHVETLPFANASSRMETVYPHEEPLREWKIQAFIDGDSMTLEIVTMESWAEYAEKLLLDLADVARLLVREPRGTLF